MNKIVFFHKGYGNIMLVEEDKKLIECCIVKDEVEQSNSSELLELAKQELKEYLNGKRQNFDIPLLIQGTINEKKVYQKLQKSSYGELMSYKDLGNEIGLENSARFIGNTMRKNKLLFFIPCHRVVRSDGGLGGYAFGLNIKENLLYMEGSL